MYQNWSTISLISNSGGAQGQALWSAWHTPTIYQKNIHGLDRNEAPSSTFSTDNCPHHVQPGISTAEISSQRLLLGDFNKMRTSRVTGSFHLKYNIVDKPRRNGAILGKILTKMAYFYPTPEICSHLGKSDHNIIAAIPCMGTTWKHRPCSKTITTTRHVTAETINEYSPQIWPPSVGRHCTSSHVPTNN